MNLNNSPYRIKTSDQSLRERFFSNWRDSLPVLTTLGELEGNSRSIKYLTERYLKEIAEKDQQIMVLQRRYEAAKEIAQRYNSEPVEILIDRMV